MPARTMTQLFKQLGLSSDEASMALFLSQHDGVCRECGLVQAPIWSDSQRNFLTEAIAQDSEWSMPAEALLAALSRPA